MTKRLLVFYDQVIVSGTSFLSTILVSRFFGFEAVGKFAIYLMVFQLLLMCQTACVVNPMMTRLYGLVFYAKLNSYIVLLLVVSYFVLFYEDNSSYFELFVLIFYPFSMLHYEFYRRKLFFEEKYIRALSSDCVRSIFVLLLLYLVYKAELYDLYGVHSLLFVFMTSCLVFVVFFSKEVSGFYRKSGKWFWYKSRNSLSYSFWLLVSGAINWSSSSLPYFIVSVIFGDEKLGVVRAIQNLTGIFNVVYQSLENIFPKIVSYKKRIGGGGAAFEYIVRLSLKIGGFLLFSILIISYFSNEILSAIYGETFSDYMGLVYLMFVYTLLSFFSFPFSYYLRVSNIVKNIFYADCISLVMIFMGGGVAYFSLTVESIFFVMIASKASQVFWLIYSSYRDVSNKRTWVAS